MQKASKMQDEMQDEKNKTGSAFSIYALPVSVTRGNRSPFTIVHTPLIYWIYSAFYRISVHLVNPHKIGIWLCVTSKMQDEMQDAKANDKV